jgi:Zn-dependent metalloprotease
MLNKIKCIVCAILLTCNAIIAKTYIGTEASNIIVGANKIIINDVNNTFKFIVFDKTQAPKESERTNWVQNVLLKNTESTFIEKSIATDKLGCTHYKYIQKIGAVAIAYSTITVHCRNNIIESISGEYYPTNSIEAAENYSVTDAIQQSKDYFKTKKIFFDKSTESIDKSTFVEKIYYPTKNNAIILCNKIDIYVHKPIAKRAYLYISTSNNQIIFEENRIHETNVVGTAVTQYCGTKPITTDSVAPSMFHLNETGARDIHTLNLNNTNNYSASTEFSDADNYWNDTTNQDDAALDAHFGAEKTWDYYLNTFSRNSFDNNGSEIASYIHYGTGFVNAFWDGSVMTYGDGDGVNYGPLTSTDVVGHEITHAVTQYAAGLIYANESGALNESYSDIFGVAIDYYANPTTANFLMGDQFNVNGIPFRNMSDPNATNDPDTYQGLYWDFAQEVHKNSAIQNYWYYLLCTGGSGTNDNNDAYAITSITMDHASAIAYRALTVYHTPNSTYADARTYTIQSAIDLYGTCGIDEINVTNAWHAVGVGGPYSNAVIANFLSYDTPLCGTPASASFINNSINATSYSWDFGDGGTSTLANPIHSYSGLGNFTVTLIATGTAFCGNSDTLILPNYISVTNNAAPVAASCIPTTTSTCCSNGIFNVTINTINKTSGNALEGYKDFSCGNNTTLTAGGTYLFSATTSGLDSQYIKVFIDFDNNGIFTSTESVYSSPKKVGLHSNFINTSSLAVLNTPLRMRVISSTFIIVNACNAITNGQAEDYAITFIAPTLPPVADFVMSTNPVTVGNSIYFQDISTNAPSTWTWTINGGTPSSAVTQNVSSLFSTIGTYNVKLVVSNAFGMDSITKVVNVVNVYTLCNPNSSQSSTAISGLLYDSGGPNSDYQDNESCNFLINPICADSIQLNFTAFDLEFGWDFLTVYDGNNSASPVIYFGSGNTIPPTLTAYSGNMFIELITDAYVVESGFAANWNVFTSSLAAPNANFIFSPTNPTTSTLVNFTNTSSPNGIFWFWTFGDGATSNLQNPAHTYSFVGTYLITLTVTNCLGQDTFSQWITVSNAPIANFMANPLIVWEGQSVQYTDLTTNNPTIWNWNLLGATPNSSTIQNPNVTYNTAGIYDATLMATNSSGSDTQTNFNYIQVNALPNTSANYAVVNPCTFEVTLTGQLPIPYTDNNWIFGDGTFLNTYSPITTHIFPSAGTYTVQFVAESPYGNDTAMFIVYIPEIIATASNSGSLNVGSPITMNIYSNVLISSYSWNYGDATPGSNAPNPIHAYTSVGTYTVSCTLQSQGACNKTVFDTIIIQAPENVNEINSDTIFLTVSPNPFHNKLIYKINNLAFAKNMNIRLVNSVGEIVYENQFRHLALENKEFTIEQNIATGMYTLEAWVDEKQYKVKVIKR